MREPDGQARAGSPRPVSSPATVFANRPQAGRPLQGTPALPIDDNRAIHGAKTNLPTSRSLDIRGMYDGWQRWLARLGTACTRTSLRSLWLQQVPPSGLGLPFNQTAKQPARACLRWVRATALAPAFAFTCTCTCTCICKCTRTCYPGAVRSGTKHHHQALTMYLQVPRRTPEGLAKVPTQLGIVGALRSTCTRKTS